jgi:hypothetical protein
MPPVGFETTVSTGERPQTYALDRASAETGATLLQTQNEILGKEARKVINHRTTPACTPVHKPAQPNPQFRIPSPKRNSETSSQVTHRRQ